MIEEIIQYWLNELRYDEPIMIKKSYKQNVVQIIATHPGWLIGKAGADWKKLTDRLSVKHWTPELVEAHEIICGYNAKIDTRNWGAIVDERIESRMALWDM